MNSICFAKYTLCHSEVMVGRLKFTLQNANMFNWFQTVPLAIYSIIIIVQIAESKEILNINKVSTFSIKQYKEFQYSESFTFSERKI